MPANIIFINSRGEEVVLEDTEHMRRTAEMYGREGAEFPSIKVTEAKYGDGSTNIVAMQLEPREITLHFWMDQRTQFFREKFEEIKHVLLQTGQQEGNWGKLKIRGRSGHFFYLNCAYVSGLDEVVRESWSWVKFALTFRATDPYFYNGFDYSYLIEQKNGYLYFNNAIITDSEAEAKTITRYAENNDSNLYFKVPNENKWYAILPYDSSHMPNAEKTLFFEDAVIFSSMAEAKTATGDNNQRDDAHPGSHWWPVTFEETKVFDTAAEVIQYLGKPNAAHGTDYWDIEVGNAVKFQTRKTETKYYAILKNNCLFLSSAKGSTVEDLFIQGEKVYPEIVINGPAENIIITNETTGRKIELDPSIVLDVNEQIRIITTPLKRKVTQKLRNGREKNLIPWLSADSTLDWWMAHGSNNVSFNNSATTPESYAKFIYQERWASIQ